MNPRFAGLKKIPPEPAARMLALANARLRTPLAAPARAGVEEVLAELDAAGAHVDMLRLLAVALPARERTWWACLAARDILPPDPDPLPRALAAAEAWVRKPGDEARSAARTAIDAADPGDETTLCATAALFGDGTLGPGHLADHPAPPGASEAAVFGMVLMAIGRSGAPDFPTAANLMIDRALDIARGGNGRVAPLREKETET